MYTVKIAEYIVNTQLSFAFPYINNDDREKHFYLQ
jgi:hypothetical protein